MKNNNYKKSGDLRGCKKDKSKKKQAKKKVRKEILLDFPPEHLARNIEYQRYEPNPFN